MKLIFAALLFLAIPAFATNGGLREIDPSFINQRVGNPALKLNAEGSGSDDVFQLNANSGQASNALLVNVKDSGGASQFNIDKFGNLSENAIANFGGTSNFTGALNAGGNSFQVAPGGVASLNRGGANFQILSPFSNSSGVAEPLDIMTSLSQSGTAGFSGIFENVIENSMGSGNYYLMELQKNSSDTFTLDHNGIATLLNQGRLNLNGMDGSSLGTYTPLFITPSINETGTASYTGIFENVTENTTGSGSKLLMDLELGSVSQFSVDHAGNGIFHGQVSASSVNAPNAAGFLPFSTGSLTAISANEMVGAGQAARALSVSNVVGSATTFTCSVNPVLTLFDCGASAGACNSGTAVGSVTLTAAGSVTAGSVTHASIVSGDYWAWEITAGTCTVLDASGSAGL